MTMRRKYRYSMGDFFNAAKSLGSEAAMEAIVEEIEELSPNWWCMPFIEADGYLDSRPAFPCGSHHTYRHWPGNGSFRVGAVIRSKRRILLRGIEASLVCNMGRMAAHTGREVTFEDMLECQHEFAPGVAELSMTSEAPLQPDADGRYPVPQPGIVTDREY